MQHFSETAEASLLDRAPFTFKHKLADHPTLTVESLARRVGLSRPVFAREFQRALGLSPMRYLTQRRMLAAAALLLGSDAALAEVARRVGYESEFAFNRAFKRHYQVPPGVYRQQPPVACALRAAA